MKVEINGNEIRIKTKNDKVGHIRIYVSEDKSYDLINLSTIKGIMEYGNLPYIKIYEDHIQINGEIMK